MKNSIVNSFFLKFFGSVLTAFIIILLSAVFFLFPEVRDTTLIGRFYITSVTAIIITFIITGYLVWSYILDPVKKFRQDLTDAAAGDLTIESSFPDEQGVMYEVNEDFKDFKGQMRLRIEKLQYARSYMETVFLNMSDGVMVLDGQGNILLMNNALKAVLKAPDNVKGKRPIEVLRNSELQAITEKVLAESSDPIIEEIFVLLPERRSFVVHATPIIKNEKKEAVAMVFHETTMMKQYEQMRKDFVANVSHELRTPISNIKGYIETLLDGAMEEGEHASEFLGIIHEESERLSSLVTDLLDISKIESGRLRPELESLDICRTVSSVLEKLGEKASKKNMTLENRIPKETFTVKADEMLLYQVVFNLVDNAVKYVQDHGNVIVEAHPDNGYFRVDISDDGPGIPEDETERIFERFYRLDKARSRELGGTGLGLSIAKHIIQEHGGDLWVHSKPAKGSTFSFTVPRSTSDRTA